MRKGGRNKQSGTAYGGQVIDPTKNVIDLVNQEKGRNNDIRLADEKFRDYQIANLEKILNLHIMYQDKLTDKESERIDAVNKVDAAAVALATEKTNATADLLTRQLTQLSTALSDRLSAVETNISLMLGKGSVSEPLIEQVLKEVKILRADMNTSKGASAGRYGLWTIILGVVALVATSLAIIGFFFNG